MTTQAVTGGFSAVAARGLRQPSRHDLPGLGTSAGIHLDASAKPERRL
jgi:hypothetical protein